MRRRLSELRSRAKECQSVIANRCPRAAFVIKEKENERFSSLNEVFTSAV